MAEHKITLEWKRETESFTYDSYNRDHMWIFERPGSCIGGAGVPWQSCAGES